MKRQPGEAAAASSAAPAPLYWEEVGQGPPVVLIHGALVTHSDWPADVIYPLARDARVISIDRPGHGQSPRLPGRGGSDDQARQIHAALWPALGAPAILVAHSFGAMTALAFAELFPEACAGLVLVAPVCFPELRPEHAYLAPRSLPVIGPWLSLLASLTVDAPFLRSVHHLMFAPQAVPEAWLRRYPMARIFTTEAFVREGEDASAIAPFHPSAYRDVSRLTLPIRMIQGSSDLIILGGWHARLLSALAPDAHLTWLPGVGHMAHHARAALLVEEVRQVMSVTQPKAS